jgi:hypothetical protein
MEVTEINNRYKSKNDLSFGCSLLIPTVPFVIPGMYYVGKGLYNLCRKRKRAN